MNEINNDDGPDFPGTAPLPPAAEPAAAGPAATGPAATGPAVSGPGTYAPPSPYGYRPAAANNYPAARTGKSIWFWLGLGAVGFVLVVGVLFFAAWKMTAGGGDVEDAGGPAFGGGRIGVIDVDGVILSAEQMEADLQKFADDDSIKAIVLHVNSPGGGAAASQEIYGEVLRLRKQHKKPIVTSIETVGASGAYYIASATDKIYANDASVVGSIGVIAEWVNYGGLMQWAKLKPVMLKAGRLKDAGTPTRDPTPEEQAYLQGLIDNMYGQFVRDVAAGRGIPEPAVKEMATGQVWTGQEGLPLHLVDKIGTYRDCIRDVAAQVGIKGQPTLVKPSRPHHGIWSAVNGESEIDWLNPAKTVSDAVSKALEENPGFYFLWK